MRKRPNLTIEKFVKQLATVAHRPDLYNPYRGHGGPIRRANLIRYLTLLRQSSSGHILVGEAIGYRGGRMTGIPFTSEDLMLNGALPHAVLGASQGYRRVPSRGPLWREASASIVWSTIRNQPALPILWNALPFHPHVANQRLSNRTPRVNELDLGIPYLSALLTLFPGSRLIAVGRRAETALRRHGYDHVAIRHPSHGGKRDFVAGIRKYLE